MDTNHSTIDIPATRDYVLDVLVDEHRQQCHYDSSADPDASLTFDSTVADWRNACDLIGWRQLGHAMNEGWGTSFTNAQWRSALVPAKSKTLGNVCNLIATEATSPTIRPITLFDRPCRPAAAFLTIRSLLNDAGADVSSIGPSTLLDDFTKNYLLTFLGPISRLTPGAIPNVKIHNPFYDTISVLMILSLPMLLGGWCLYVNALSPSVLILAILFHVASWLLQFMASKKKPKSVQFGNLQTFRDLATVIADHAHNNPVG